MTTEPEDQNTPTRWWYYVDSLMKATETNKSQLAEAVGVARSTPGYWERGVGGPDPHVARKVALHFGRPIAEAFDRAEFATMEELGITTTAPTPEAKDLPNEVLVAEIGRRLSEASNQPSAAPEQTPGTTTVRAQGKRQSVKP
jgi:DNA-binding XRE family transcriptional regulator